MILSKEISIPGSKRIKKEKSSDEDDEESNGRKNPDRVQEYYNPPSDPCCICLHEEKESPKNTFLLSQEDKEVISFFYDYDVNIICGEHHKYVFKTFPSNQRSCKNLFEKHKKAIRESLRPITLPFAKQVFQYTRFHLKPGEKTCIDCRKQLDVLIKNGIEEADSGGPSSSQFSNFSDTSEGMKIKDKEKDERMKKLEKTEEDYLLIMENIKKILPTLGKEGKQAILSILPNDSINKISKDTGESRYNVKKSQFGEGLLTERKPHGGRIKEEVREMVQDFFFREDISWTMPGVKDTVSVKVDGVKTPLQKHILHYKMKDCYKKFIEENPNVKIGLEKFRQFRPPQVRFAGCSGSLLVCQCVACRNPELMVNTSYLHDDDTFTHELLGPEHQGHITIDDLVKLIICTNPTEDCYMDQCDECIYKRTDLKDQLLQICEVLEIDSFEYETWTNKDWSQQHTVEKPTIMFITDLIQCLVEYKQHWFIAREQHKYFSWLQKNLEPNHCLILMDFAGLLLMPLKFMTKHLMFVT